MVVPGRSAVTSRGLFTPEFCELSPQWFSVLREAMVDRVMAGWSQDSGENQRELHAILTGCWSPLT